MQRMIFLIVAAFLMGACNQADQENNIDSQIAAGDKIVTASVEEILAQPSEYEGKEVAISGMVTHVCRHGGQKCFVVGADGETQIRIVPGGDIDEFKIELEGSTVAFKGVFRVLNTEQAAELETEYESEATHDQEMAHSEAEQADYFIEATDFREIIQ